MVKYWIKHSILDGSIAPVGPGSPHYRDFKITLKHATFGWTPLDE